MKAALAVIALMLAAVPARAQDLGTLCELLPVKEHFTGADYVPGVDVHGNPVVSADVKAQAADMLDVIKIPVTIDLAQQIGQPLPAGTEMQAQVAMIEVHKDSRVVYNGQELTTQVYALCGKQPFDIEAAAGEPQKVAPEPEPAPEPETKPIQEPVEDDIIWGEGY